MSPMGIPSNQLLFDLLQQLNILTPQLSHVVALRYNEAGGERPLVDFLVEDGYLGLAHVGRLAAIERSQGGDLSSEARDALTYLRQQLVQSRHLDTGVSASTTQHDLPRHKTQRIESVVDDFDDAH